MAGQGVCLADGKAGMGWAHPPLISLSAILALFMSHTMSRVKPLFFREVVNEPAKLKICKPCIHFQNLHFQKYKNHLKYTLCDGSELPTYHINQLIAVIIMITIIIMAIGHHCHHQYQAVRTVMKPILVDHLLV